MTVSYNVVDKCEVSPNPSNNWTFKSFVSSLLTLIFKSILPVGLTMSITVFIKVKMVNSDHY